MDKELQSQVEGKGGLSSDDSLALAQGVNLHLDSLSSDSDLDKDFTDVENFDEPEKESDGISFEDLGLDEITLAAIEKKGFVHPSPIQVLAIPRLLNGDANVIAKARTGTGKTAAFGLPLVQTLRSEGDHVKAIILEPTRELAMQTATEMASFTTGRYPRTAVVYGGASMGEQIRSLRRGVEIVVGTPGRVQDLIDRGVLDISKIEYFILDEGDEMLDMGFVDDIENIFSCANPECRVLLFSATIPAPILKIAQKFMGDYEIVEEEGHEEEPLLIDQKYWVVRESEKTEALIRLIDISPDFYGLVFVQKKSDADMVCKSLDEKGYMVAALHGDIPQGQREKILARFRAKRVRVLVATDVAARGIDITGITHVVNFDLPFDGPTYVHRIGRTGRAGATGMAVTFVKPEESRRKLGFLRNAIRRSAKGEMEEGTIPTVEEVIDAKRLRLFDEVKGNVFVQNTNEDAEDEVSAEAGEVSAEAVPNVLSLKKGDPIFDLLAEELCAGQNPQEVVASLLAATYGKELSKKRYGKINSVVSKDRGSKDRGGRDRDRGSRGGVSVTENQLRLYVQMGWHDGYNPRKIADFFAGLLRIRDREVDAIDMADKFCLLSLPKDAAERVLEMSKRDSSLPHMHLDSKSVSDGESYSSKSERDGFGRDKGRRGGRDRDRDFGRDRGGDREFGGRDRGRRGGRDRDRDFGHDRGDRRSSKAKGSSHSRPGVHTSTQRSSSGMAALYKKSNEY